MADEKNKAEYTCTRVTPSMVITGDVSSSDNLLVEGPVYGNIDTSSNVTVKNLVLGNLNADSASLDGAKVKGDIKLSGTVAINDKSIVVGSVKSNALKLDGKVRGNINVNESALLSESALLVGDITAQYVTAQTGSRILGKITTIGLNQNTDIDKEFDLAEFNTTGGDF